MRACAIIVRYVAGMSPLYGALVSEEEAALTGEVRRCGMLRERRARTNDIHRRSAVVVR